MSGSSVDVDSEERAGGRVPSRLAVLGVVLSPILLLLFLRALGSPRDISGSESPATELDQLRWETQALRMEAELASGEGPYLVLDLPANVLTLKFQGAVLREFPLLKASIRTPRITGWRGGPSAALNSIWGEGVRLPTIHIEQMVIVSDSVAPPDPSGTVAFIPPSPEEAIPTPSSFRILFPNRLSLVVAAERADTLEGDGRAGPSARGGALTQWVRLKSWQGDRLQLRLTLPEEMAGALYRSLSPGTPLMVIGPAPTAASDTAREIA